MSNYMAVGRTNYFRVTDDSRYDELFENISANDGKWDYSRKNANGIIYHCFAVEGGLDWREPDEYDSNLDYFIDELQKILPEDEAIIYTEAGHEKHRYVVGFSLVITSKSIDWIQLPENALFKAREYLGPNFTTQMEY